MEILTCKLIEIVICSPKLSKGLAIRKAIGQLQVCRELFTGSAGKGSAP